MRFLTLLIFVAAVIALTLQAFADTPLMGVENTARPGGVYASLNTTDATACAQLCAQDGICMAWTYRAAGAPSCELKAVAPTPVAEIGARSGLSARAPDFARRLALAEPVMPAPSEPYTGAPRDLHAEAELLGGPDGRSNDLVLRARFGR